MIIMRRFTKDNREMARILVENKISYFNKFYKFNINRIAIKNQRKRWGSCSSKANLNFNYKIIFLEPQFADYLIVHELCHLKEFNHSKKFWNLVEKTIPDYKTINQRLRKLPINLI
jgi:hypothetical protein